MTVVYFLINIIVNGNYGDRTNIDFVFSVEISVWKYIFNQLVLDNVCISLWPKSAYATINDLS